MKKIKAFTLLELLIGMIISTLVVGFSVMSYFIIYEQYLNYKSVKHTISDVMLMNMVIASDFTNAQTISDVDDNELIFNDDNDTLIHYHFSPEFITRQENEIIDTFKIAVNNRLPVFLLEKDNEPTNLVSAFSFDAKVLGETEHFNFTKNYAADVIINNSYVNN